MNSFIVIFVAFTLAAGANVTRPSAEIQAKIDEINNQAKTSFDAAVATGTKALSELVSILDAAGDAAVSERLATVISNCRLVHDLHVAHLSNALASGTAEDVKKVAQAMSNELPRVVMADIRHFEELATSKATSTKQARQLAKVIRSMTKQVDADLAPIVELVSQLE